MTTELLTVEEHFTIRGRGVVVVPDFPVPDGWKNRNADITIATPEGEKFETNAQFYLTHFNILDPAVPKDRRWRVVIIIPDREKDDIPVGSVIFASPELRDTLIPGSAA